MAEQWKTFPTLHFWQKLMWPKPSRSLSDVTSKHRALVGDSGLVLTVSTQDNLPSWKTVSFWALPPLCPSAVNSGITDCHRGSNLSRKNGWWQTKAGKQGMVTSQTNGGSWHCQLQSLCRIWWPAFLEYSSTGADNQTFLKSTSQWSLEFIQDEVSVCLELVMLCFWRESAPTSCCLTLPVLER